MLFRDQPMKHKFEINCQLIKDIKVPQDRLLCPIHVDNKNKQIFANILFQCVTRPDLSEVPLSCFCSLLLGLHLWFSDSLQSLKRKLEGGQTDKMKAERQCQEAQTKLEVLSKYFKEKEAELTR